MGKQTHDTYEDAAEVLETFRPLMRAIAAAGGPSCEVVLHNLDGADVDLRHTIAAIENGHVTGREVGGPSTSLGLNVLRNRKEDHDAFGYRGFTDDGRELRCSSIYLRNHAGDIIAALCINVDLSIVQHARSLLESLLPGQQVSANASPDEYFGRDLVSVMDTMITEAIREVGRPVTQMTREDKVGVLAHLDERGATQMRKSVETIAVRLGISRVTAYAYLDEGRRAAN
ncbi:helix-turn-helix transcriptional regulator [Microbacterium sp.]|uniref:helix-turn-helix transcriptional regulator n=1 Tax=Microbacterium sp. TaxID=51671 RepID=UPI003F9B5A8E